MIVIKTMSDSENVSGMNQMCIPEVFHQTLMEEKL